MPTDIPHGDANVDLPRLFASSLEGRYANDEDRAFYARTVLGSSGVDASGRIAAYSAAYLPNDASALLSTYVVIPGQEDQAYSQEQLVATLFGHGAPHLPRSHYIAELKLQGLQPVFDKAYSLATPLHLPALAVMHVVEESGRDHVEFVAPRQVKSDLLISYMQMRFAAGLE